MRFAALETSAEWCSVALWCDGETSAIECRAPTSHGEVVLPMLERLLAAAGVTAAELQGIAFGAGPGAFTGLRIACGLAQGMAWARELPVLGVSTLEAIAEESGAAKVVACVDARMREVYYSALSREARAPGEGQWREVVAPLCASPGDVPVPEGGDWVGCGSGFAVYGASLGDALRGHLRGVDVNARASAVAIARLAAPRLAMGQGVDAAQALPFYVRDKVAYTEQERAGR